MNGEGNGIEKEDKEKGKEMNDWQEKEQRDKLEEMMKMIYTMAVK